MIELLKQQHRLRETLFMGIMALSCFGFSVFRLIYTDTKAFWFLNWNLFLAFIPWAATSLAIISPKIQKNRFAIAAILTVWLIFFPNAPYILTDLLHLRDASSMPVWFDLILILCFAWVGLLFGFLSLWDIEKIMKMKVNNKWIAFSSVILLFISSFGIYAGRYLRWNSWDVVSKPFELTNDMGDHLINVFVHPRTWGMTIFMGLFLNIMYWSFKLIRKRIE